MATQTPGDTRAGEGLQRGSVGTSGHIGQLPPGDTQNQAERDHTRNGDHQPDLLDRGGAVNPVRGGDAGL